MSISYRLKYIAGLVTAGSRIADIGTDHGYVPVFLLREGIASHAIAVDISEGSLQKARELAERAGLQDRMECRLADGLSGVLPGEADCIIISGMGGILMRKILDAGLETVLSSREVILSPHRNPELILEFLEIHGFTLVRDEIITDKKRSYRVFKGCRLPED
ncbi:MAG: SAM-dependent methyltransferase [Parasporobacterium sp.]|nr:SAM-dependent methyltransferase [Parasporobacterium sp.]